MKNTTTRFKLAFVSVSILSLLFGGAQSAAGAANARTWDGGGATAIWTTLANWDIASVLNNGDTVTFATAFTSGTAVDIAAPRIISTLTISTTTDFSLSAGALTISAGTLTRSAASGTTTIYSAVALGANGTWTIEGNLTVGGVISGNFYLDKLGAGTLVLSGANSFGGVLYVETGTLS